MKNKWLYILGCAIILTLPSNISFGEETLSTSTGSFEGIGNTTETSSTHNRESSTINSTEEVEENTSPIIKEFLTPIYGVLNTEEPIFYENEDDAQKATNQQDGTIFINQILQIQSEYHFNNNTVFYKALTNTNDIIFININSLVRKESEKFITLSSKSDFNVYQDTTLTNVLPTDTIINRTYKIQEEVTLDNHTYLSLFNSKNLFIGFIEKGIFSETLKENGQYNNFNQYVNVTTTNQNLYSNFDWKKKNTSSNILNQTFLAKGIYYHYSGENYLSLFDSNDVWYGYINQKFVTVSDSRFGNSFSLNQYVTITSKNYDIYSDLNWSKKVLSGTVQNKTYLAKEIFHHINGNQYISLYDTNNKLFGYINRKGTTDADGPQGIYHTYNKFVTVKSNNYQFFSNFKWNPKSNSSSVFGKTYKAKGIYYHQNGSKYLSVYDSKNKWLGYINQNAMSISDSPQGSYQNLNKYATVTSSNYDIWQNFSWKKKSHSKNYRNQTLHAKGKYNHYNGNTYYSLYNNKNQWLGYINSNAMTIADGPQGIYQSYGKNVTFSTADYPVWRNFNWKTQNTSVNIKGKTYMARGIYRHFNGSSYYSIYDKNNWIGYVNSKAAQNYDMNKLIPDTESLLAVTHVVRQKILDTSSNPKAVIDRVLFMPTLTRNQITYQDGLFVVSLKGKNVGTDEVRLTPKEIAPAVNYKLLPPDEIKGAIPVLNNNKKYVALTFDDGPNPNTTPQLLNILKQKKVKASFFMLGNNANAYPSVAKRVSNEGHQIGSHSYSHPQLTSLSAYQVANQTREADKAIYLATGILPKTFRPPYGAINHSVSNTVSKPSIMWSIDTRDWESRNPTAINNVVNRNIHNGAIILLHDIHQTSVNSVPQMIDNLRRQGYEFVTVDELLEMNHRPLHGYFSRTSNRKY